MTLHPLSRVRQLGLTLLELVIVLAILAVLAGIVVMNLGNLRVQSADGSQQSVEETAARETFQRLREASERYSKETGQWPEYIGDLFLRPSGMNAFEPAYGTGWNGPYLLPTGARYQSGDWHPEASGFSATYRRVAPPDADTAVLDAWGCPIVIQQAGTDSVRLVSGGANRQLETADDPDGTGRGDDLTWFLAVPDPLAP